MMKLNSLSILHVDDDEVDLLSVKRGINKNFDNITLMSEKNPNKALELINQKPFDLIISDINMGPPNGLEFLSKIKTIPVIIFSADNKSEIRNKALQLGALEYFNKEFNTENTIVDLTKFIQDFLLKHSSS